MRAGHHTRFGSMMASPPDHHNEFSFGPFPTRWPVRLCRTSHWMCGRRSRSCSSDDGGGGGGSEGGCGDTGDGDDGGGCDSSCVCGCCGCCGSGGGDGGDCSSAMRLHLRGATATLPETLAGIPRHLRFASLLYDRISSGVISAILFRPAALGAFSGLKDHHCHGVFAMPASARGCPIPLPIDGASPIRDALREYTGSSRTAGNCQLPL